GRTVHWATGLQHQKQKNHGLRASLRFALRPWFQDSHRKWYNYWGQVSSVLFFYLIVLNILQQKDKIIKKVSQSKLKNLLK
ncbi:MAG: hypothetical protein QF451_06420, partial [Nitrospinota bacterium]|nr:hypothetical protein [Nitrospinota bacterium]